MILNQITIACTDYAASTAFYKALGLIQIVDAPPHYARFEMPDGDGATLSIHQRESAPTPGSVLYFDHESAQALDTHVNQLKAAGFVFSQEPRR